QLDRVAVLRRVVGDAVERVGVVRVQRQCVHGTGLGRTQTCAKVDVTRLVARRVFIGDVRRQYLRALRAQLERLGMHTQGLVEVDTHGTPSVIDGERCGTTQAGPAPCCLFGDAGQRLGVGR